jgi:hypothetical protein
MHNPNTTTTTTTTTITTITTITTSHISISISETQKRT